MCTASLNAFSSNKNSKEEILVGRTVQKILFSEFSSIYKSFCNDLTLSNIKPVEKIPPNPEKMWKYLKNIEYLPKKCKIFKFQEKGQNI